MKNRMLALLSCFFITTLFLSACVKNARTAKDSILFLGAESYFRYLDEVAPQVFINVFDDNTEYNYKNLYNESFLATKLESQYKVDQNPFIDFENPHDKDILKEMEEISVSSKLRLYNQNNCIISMEMVFDTVFPTYSQDANYHFYERYYADTMYVVGQAGNTGRFMMYGMTDCYIEMSREDVNGSIIDGEHWEYNYTAWTIIVGDKTKAGISEFSYFECVAVDDESYYPTGSIRAFNDKDGISRFYK